MLRKWLRRLCLVVMAVCLVVAAADLYSLWKEEREYDRLWGLASGQEEGSRRSEWDGEEGVDIAALQKLNPQCVGYISIKDTPLSYPVMLTTEEDGMFYLHHAFDRSYHGNGTPFLDMRCNVEDPSDNLIVYGHNTRNTKMFSCLRFYREQEYFTEHPIIRFDHKNGGNYRIFSVLFESLSDQNNRDIFAKIDRDPDHEEEWEEFLTYLKEHSLYDTGVEVETTDKILTLSTCYRPIDNGRVLIFAKKVEESHRTGDSSASTTSPAQTAIH